MSTSQAFRYPYLISKYADPLFGFAVGVMAFGTYEKRVKREDGHTLKELISAKIDSYKSKSGEESK